MRTDAINLIAPVFLFEMTDYVRQRVLDTTYFKISANEWLSS